MKIDSESEEMQWILTKFLMDSLEAMPQLVALGMQRKKYIKIWQQQNLNNDRLKEWLPVNATKLDD